LAAELKADGLHISLICAYRMIRPCGDENQYSGTWRTISGVDFSRELRIPL